MIDKKELLKVFVEKNMSQRKLAKLMGKSAGTINKWINNRSFPTTDEVVQMCNILGIEDNEQKIKIFLNQPSQK